MDQTAHTNPVDEFLERHKSEIAEPYRAWIREAAAKAIKGDLINLNHCPAHLRNELLDMILEEAETRRRRIEADYLIRSKGKKFLTGNKTLWI